MLYDLKDEQWERIKDSLPGKEGDSSCQNLSSNFYCNCTAQT
ncbi:transposase [Wolbachia endosymbiont of Armadillidium vulgare str. wVulC]|nr:transposase [Wolbachia endosymbiont of Armadillidium vulgare str. wVulC]